jgi:hypothetical protein
MRKAILVMIVCAICVCGFGTASAGVLSVLSSGNTLDDHITDHSLGFISNASGDTSTTPNAGDVAWGVVRVASVTPGSVGASPVVPGITDFAYIVYSVQLQSSPGTGQWVYQATTQSNYTLANLMGLSGTAATQVNPNSVAAVVEWNGTGVNPFTNTTKYPFTQQELWLNSTTLATGSGSLKEDIQTLMTNSDFLFAVGLSTGLSDPNGDMFVSSVNSFNTLKLDVNARLSVTGAGTGVNIADFKEVNALPGFENIIQNASQTINSLTYNSSGLIRTHDVGDYVVNYVPEPVSMTAVVGVGVFAGLGLMLRRRARKS